MLKTYWFYSTITGCVSVFASSLCFPVGVTSSAVGIKICVIFAEIKNYKSIKKKKKKYDKTVLLEKDKLNTSKVILVNNALREYNEMKEEIKNLKVLWNILYKNNGMVLCHL